MDEDARRLAQRIDHTLVRPDATVEDIADSFDKITDLTDAAPRGMLQLGG